MRRNTRPPNRRNKATAPATEVAKRKAKRKEERRAKKRRVGVRVGGGRSDDDGGLVGGEGVDSSSDDEGRLLGDDGDKSGSKKMREKKKKKKEKKRKKDSDNTAKQDSGLKSDFYDDLDPSVAAAIRKDDEEIARLEEDLGLSSGNKKQRKKLHKEYAKLEGYGDDFGDFLDGIDGMLGRITGGDDDGDDDDSGGGGGGYVEDEYSDDSECEELIPMKDPVGEDENDIQVSSSDDDDDSDDSNSDKNSNKNTTDGIEDDNSDSNSDTNSSEDDDDDEDSKDDSTEAAVIRDHDAKDTYRPSDGEDLYGNILPSADTDSHPKPTKYIPPHLRNANANANTNTNQPSTHKPPPPDDPQRSTTLRTIQRHLNSHLNRLSDSTLESVGQSISTTLYSSPLYSNNDVDECFWSSIRSACVGRYVLRKVLIPVYMACAAGVHYRTSRDSGGGGFGAFVLERVVLELWDVLEKSRMGGGGAGKKNDRDDDDDDDDLVQDKEASNLTLLLCYLYNFSVIHCTIIYDIIRHLIERFTETDVELLLLILSHCGHRLRTDDPTALKDIVLSVKERTSTNTDPHDVSTSSRARHMIDAITDLKNNKRRKIDDTHAEKVGFYRKIIGRMKTAVAMKSKGDRVVDSNSIRITLEDILEIENRGRWWKVGASWSGTQKSRSPNNPNNRSTTPSSENEQQQQPPPQPTTTPQDEQHQHLLTLATKQRMNTDLRRSIFCIIMGSDDCQEAFTAILQAGHFRGKDEREVVRVILHCCGNEKVYNPYYAHLATRVCEARPGTRFTFQLTFWDAFRKFGNSDDGDGDGRGRNSGSTADGMTARKAANLAKMLAHLWMEGRLGINVLKPIDVVPEGMSEAAIVFLTVLFGTVFEALEDPREVTALFQKGAASAAVSRQMREGNNGDEDEDDDVLAEAIDGREALKESISVFLLHFMEEHPNNVKKSRFRKNFKAAVKACDNDNLDFMI